MTERCTYCGNILQGEPVISSPTIPITREGMFSLLEQLYEAISDSSDKQLARSEEVRILSTEVIALEKSGGNSSDTYFEKHVAQLSAENELKIGEGYTQGLRAAREMLFDAFKAWERESALDGVKKEKT